MAEYTGGLEDNLDLPQSSIDILEARYLAKDQDKRILETGEDMYRRVAKDIATADAFYLDGLKDKVNRYTPTQELYEIASTDPRIQQKEEEFFTLMSKGYFIPNSPTLMNAGRQLQQLAACFVLPVGDSMKEIFDAVKYTALIHKSGGGTGFDFSSLRGDKSAVGTTGGIASGPVSFMQVFDAATETVKQGGKRRGANMGILRVDHPDILEFISCKKDKGLPNFNISVAATDEFMHAARNKKNYSLIDPRTNKKVGELDAKKVYNELVQKAWQGADPGIIFIDRMNQYNPTPELGDIEATNPCGEQPLLPNEACNLGAINLREMVTKEGELDRKKLKQIIRTSIRFLDNVIDRSKYPLPQIEEMALGNRKIGLGIMGFADYLVKRRISYNSQEGLDAAEEVMELINTTSEDESKNLAKERGAFPNFDKSIYKNGQPIRNAARTTIAPTGTTATINRNTSSGCEPLFDWIFKRNVKETIGTDLIEVNKGFEEWFLEKDPDNKKYLIALAKEEITKKDLPMSPEMKEELKHLFPNAHDIPPEQHVKMQAAFQKYVNSSISKTVNMPSNATSEDVKAVYDLAFDLGCKGITIYRDGSKENQVLTSVENTGGLEKITLVQNQVSPDQRITKKAQAIKYKVKRQQNGDSLHIIMTSDLYIDDNTKRAYFIPAEVFQQRVPLGNSISVSFAQSGMDRTEIFKGSNPNYIELVKRLQSASSNEEEGMGPSKVKSIEHAVGLVFEDYFLRNGIIVEQEGRLTNVIQKNQLRRVKEDSEEYKKLMSQVNLSNQEGEKELTINGNNGKITNGVCPDCHSELTFQEGCEGCACGYSKCN